MIHLVIVRRNTVTKIGMLMELVTASLIISEIEAGISTLGLQIRLDSMYICRVTALSILYQSMVIRASLL